MDAELRAGRSLIINKKAATRSEFNPAIKGTPIVDIKSFYDQQALEELCHAII